MMKNNQIKGKDTIAAIGIGAMIVFIALVLVAAVASAVIIQTGEKLQQNAQQTGSDTQRELGGKITINSMFVEVGTDTYLMFFESAPGSDVLDPAEITWQMSCEDGGGNYQYVTADFSNALNIDDAADDGTGGLEVGTIVPGAGYSLVIDVVVGAVAPLPAADCSADTLGVNGQATFWIHVNGGGSTYETLFISDTSEGSFVV